MSAIINNYIQLMRLDKPVGILLLLWPTLWGLWLAAAGHPHLNTVIIFVCGVILMRSAGCIINDIADRNFDGHVSRTQKRPIATGKISVKSALSLFFILLFFAFLLVLSLNTLTIQLALIGALLATIYPFLKRVTHLPQFGLGLAFAWGVPMAFAAETNSIPFQAWIVFLAAALWPIIYDTMYAMVDQQDDVKIGVKSTAILFGKHTVLLIALLQLLFLITLYVIGYLFELQWPYFLSIAIAALLFCYQLILIKDHNPDKCFSAFLNNQWVGFVVFLGVLANYL